MKTISLNIELTYDDETMHGQDKEAIDWFYQDILAGKNGQLSLFSNDIGDVVGDVNVLPDPDVVRIPRKVLEDANKTYKYLWLCIQALDIKVDVLEQHTRIFSDGNDLSVQRLIAESKSLMTNNQAINDLMNYKEGV